MSRTLLIAVALATFAVPTLAQEAKTDLGTDRQGLIAAAGEVDALIAADLRTQGIAPHEMTRDDEFLRRLYLDLAGRIPTYDEARAFLDSQSPYKRHELIDKLVDSEAYVSHTFNYWADLLRVKTRLHPQVYGGPYIDWIKQSIRENLPYDQFVYSLLAAEGRVADDGATGYFIRDSGMPLDNMSNTVRIFLGTQIGCAQCHDHPHDVWSQYEFYEMAAFTFGTATRSRVEGREMAQVRRAAAESDLSQREQTLLRQLFVSQSYNVNDNGRPVRLPDDYKYSDAKPGDAVAPHTLFGHDARVGKGRPPRQVMAEWLTSPDNPRFATVIANRYWARLLGVGVVDPVDNFTDETKPSNPVLLQYLTGAMKAMRFDLKAYTRMVCYTQAYQRQSTPTELQPGEAYHFQGPLLRRMSSEQLWDSVATLIVPELDGRPGIERYTGRMGIRTVDPTTKSPQELVAIVKEYGNEGDMRRRIGRDMLRDQPAIYRGYPVQLIRASEGQHPAQPGTFLHEFGASDRELIGSSHAEPTVTQALEMVNGKWSNGVLGSNSLLARNVANADDTNEKLRVIFLSILGRYPDATDMALCRAELDADPKMGMANIAWALLNTREFMFVR